MNATATTTRPRVKPAPDWRTGPPVRPRRVPFKQVFGCGLGERYPVYPAPASFEDMAYWEQQAQREDES